MKVQVVGKDFKVTEAINDYAEKKLERIDKYFENATAEVTVKVERNEQIAEVLVNANGEKYRAASEERDLYASLDKVVDILEGQIRKAKTKKDKMMRDGSIKDLNAEGLDNGNEITAHFSSHIASKICMMQFLPMDEKILSNLVDLQDKDAAIE